MKEKLKEINEVPFNIVEIKTIVKTYHHEYSDAEINSYLSQGWEILKIYTTCYDPELFYADQNAHVILGRPKGVAEYQKPLTKLDEIEEVHQISLKEKYGHRSDS